jgi:cytochrome c oxidase subunit II
MFHRKASIFPSAFIAGTLALAGPAAAQQDAQGELPALGVAHPWQLWHQNPVTPVMDRLDAFHYLLLIIMIAICVLVLALLLYVGFRFHHRRHPTPSRTSHNTVIEVIWTVVPVIILVIIAVPSFRILYYMEKAEAPEMTIKAIGHQWYWEYQYPDQGDFTFSSYMIPDEEIKPGQHRLLEVDNRIVVPVNTTVRVLTTSADVIHAWAVPAFGIKKDAIPGRMNETWFRAEAEGVFYGQCSEICGTGHGYMPLAVEVVSRERFDQWVEQAKQEFAKADGTPPTQVAANPDAR